MDLTKRQLVALRNPCFEAEDTVDPKFSLRHFDRAITSVLTLNIGME